MPQFITIGETMAAFTPCAGGPLRYVPDYRLRFAGAESNVAIGLAKLGHSVAWISRLGEDEFGHFIQNAVRGEGVDTTGCRFDAMRRTGLMFKELGPGETRVFYYREGSAASGLCPEDLDEGMFQGARVLHLTGITPVLSESCRETVFAAVELAKRHGLLLSFDPNIRRKLWGERDFTPLLRELTLCADIVLLGLAEGEALLGVRGVDALLDALFSQGRAVAVAVKDGANGAYAAAAGERHRLPPVPCKCVDPVGAGDAFNAGFLAGMLSGCSIEVCGKMGAIAGALATTTVGDIEGCPTRERMDACLAGTDEIYR